MRRVWEWMMRHLVRWLRRRRYAAMAARIHALEIELGMTTAPNRADEAARERLLMFADAVMLEQHERLITDRHAAATLLGAGFSAASVVDALGYKPTRDELREAWRVGHQAAQCPTRLETTRFADPEPIYIHGVGCPAPPFVPLHPGLIRKISQ